MQKILVLVLTLLMLSQATFSKELPSAFHSNLIYLKPKLEDGTVLKIFTDTGGGWNAISKELTEKHKWPLYERQGDRDLIYVTDMPVFAKDSSIPLASLSNWWQGKLQVVPRKKLSHLDDVDGFLGGRWHAEKILDFNYPSKMISNLASLPDISQFSKHKLGFQKNKDGNYTMAFPSFKIVIEGKTIPMLFDTGASAWPSSEAKEILKANDNQIATSFVIASIFDKWVEDHPEWLVINEACTFSKQPMIRVPEVKLGKRVVGPVWFTRRADHNFHNYMSSMMDRKIDGAIGGSALQYVRVIIDYPLETAYISNSIR